MKALLAMLVVECAVSVSACVGGVTTTAADAVRADADAQTDEVRDADGSVIARGDSGRGNPSTSDGGTAVNGSDGAVSATGGPDGSMPSDPQVIITCSGTNAMTMPGRPSPGTCAEPAGTGPIGGSGTAPVLTPGVWKNLTPAGLELGNFGIISAALDPTNPFTLYVGGGDAGGIWKTEDGGSTWSRKGMPGDTVGTCTSFLYSIYHMKVNPCDPQNLYATSGVRGATLGFWVSNDGGNTWMMPPAFKELAETKATFDVTSMAVDPGDFRHVLIASHSPWRDMGNAGILETTDGGVTWRTIMPMNDWPAGTATIAFLSDPKNNVGDSRTWLFVTDGKGFWRTTDSGANWTKVSENWGVHGGVNIYRSPVTGALYTGGYGYPQRSTDNGLTWTDTSDGAPFGYYQTVHGDGKTLYTSPACACAGSPADAPYFTSAETQGTSWTPYKGGTQKFVNGPFTLEFEKNTRTMYSVQWTAGFWALRPE